MKSSKQWLERLRAKRQPNGLTVLDRTDAPEGKCELCGTDGKELRPYGPKGEWICFECGMKDEKTTARQCARIAFGIEQH